MSSFNEDAPNNDSITKAGYKHTDVGLIPLDWALVDMEQIASIIDPQPDHRTPPESSSGEPYIGISDFLNSFKVDWDSSRKIIRSAVDKQQARFQIDKGDIVFGKIGTIGVPKFVPEVSFRFALSANVILLKPKIEPNFLMAFFYSDLFNRVLKSELHSTSQAAFGINKMRFIKVPLPNKQEQTAIANALSDVDALIQELEKLIAKKQAIKMATMQQLLTGRTRLPAFAYEKSAHHPDGRKKDYKPSELGEIPEDWETLVLASMVSALHAGVSVNSIDRIDAFTHGKHILKTSCVTSGYFDESEIKSILPIDLSRAKCSPEAGSIIVSRMNTPALVGEIGYVSQDYPALFLPDRLWQMKFKTDGSLNSRWLAYALSYPSTAKRIKDAATGTSDSMKNISKESLLDLLIPVPSFEEQTAIASILCDISQDIEAIEQRLNKARQIKQGMMQELLTGKTRLIQRSEAI